MLEEFVDEFPSTLDVAESLRTGARVTGFADDITTEFRERWLQVLCADPSPKTVGPDQTALEAWGKAAGDTDAARILPSWLRCGAPIGVLETVETAAVFPNISTDQQPKNPDALASCLAG